MDKVTTLAANAQRFGKFFIADQQEVLSCGRKAIRVFADTEFSKKQIIAIQALGALCAGNMYYKSEPETKYGWFDVAAD